MARVVCTGIDLQLMKTRKMILERAGHVVMIAINEPELLAACENHDVDVAVIGRALSRDVKKSIAANVRRFCPSVRILELYATHQGRAIEDADSWLEVPVEVPQELAVRVDELAKKKKH